MIPADRNADDLLPNSPQLRGGSPAGRPPLELVAAYVDGELDDKDRAEVERWIDSEPAAAAEVEAQRVAVGFCAQSPLDEPTAAAWDGVLAQIRARAGTPAADRSAATVIMPARTPPTRRFAAAVWAAAGVGMAAAILVALTRPPAGVSDADGADEPLPVASADDIEIVSIDGRDHGALVVGIPPVHEPLVAAEAGDVRLDGLSAGADGRIPHWQPAGDQVNVPVVLPGVSP